MILQTLKKMNVRSFQVLQKPKKLSLGRWNIETCEKVIHKKIDSSNEDHCGVCVVPPKNEKENEDEYLKYFLL